MCNVYQNNQIIKKQLFDAIKGKNITVVFENMFSTTYDSTGIQWIINGKDIVNKTKDIDVSATLSVKTYSKYIVPEYKFNESLESDFFETHQFNESNYNEVISELHKLQEKEIRKYFKFLKDNHYKDTDIYLKKSLNMLENSEATVKNIIMNANGYVNYLSIDFPNNGKLPGKMKIRVKPEYASRNIIGTSGLKLYYINGNKYDLEEDNINLDVENYYNFTIDHNSEFMLTEGTIDTLSKNNINNENNTGLNNPKTGDNILYYILMLGISFISLMIVYFKKRVN